MSEKEKKNQNDEHQEIKFDRRWTRTKLNKAKLPYVEVTSFNEGKKSKDSLLYEVARVSEYAINGSIATGNQQALALIYNYLATLVTIMELIPNSEIEEKLNKFISEKGSSDNVDLKDLKDLEF